MVECGNDLVSIFAFAFVRYYTYTDGDKKGDFARYCCFYFPFYITL